MELKRAKEVLTYNGVDISPTLLKKTDVLCINDKGKVYMHGYFQHPDFLIAIATWMRDPEGVVGA